jgi:hypothetical protein
MKRLRKLGFEGPYSGGSHQFMVYGNYRLSIPSNEEYSIPQMKMMIQEVESLLERNLTDDEWYG